MWAGKTTQLKLSVEGPEEAEFLFPMYFCFYRTSLQPSPVAHQLFKYFILYSFAF